MKKKFISEHVPRTGGNSMKIFFANSFPGRSVYFYYHQKLTNASQSTSLLLRHPSLDIIRSKLMTNYLGQKFCGLAKRALTKENICFEIKPDWIVIHGHKAVLRFRPQYPQAKLATVVRQPLERAISHYFFIRQFLATGLPAPEWMIGNETKVSLEKFLVSKEVSNFQTAYLAPLQLADFDYIGVTENLEKYGRFFSRRKHPFKEKLNLTIKPKFQLPSQITRQFESLNRLDYSLYQEACRRAGL